MKNTIEINITMPKYINTYNEGLNARQLAIKVRYEPSIEETIAEILEQAWRNYMDWNLI